MTDFVNSRDFFEQVVLVEPAEVPCALCGKWGIIGAMGQIPIVPPSLDLRGGVTVYSSLYPDTKLHNLDFTFIPSYCRSCGYVCENISQEILGARKWIEESRYKKILLEGNDIHFPFFFDKPPGILPPNAALCNAASYLYEKAGRFGDAALQSLYAAWVCDDTKGKKRQAIRFRKQALFLIKKMRRKGEFLRGRQGVTELITVDLLRRSKQFSEALKTVEEFLKKIDTHGNAILKRTLFFEKSLIEKKDSKNHSMLEVVPKWNSIPFTSFYVAGVKYRKGAKLLEKNPDVLLDQPVALLPEPANEYDENAIAIYWNDKHIGYVPRQKNSEIVALLRAGYGDELIATIEDVDSDEYYDKSIYVVLSLLDKKFFSSPDLEW